MADYSFSDSCDGAFGYIPDKPIEIIEGFGFGCVVDAESTFPIETNVSFGLGTEIELSKYTNEVFIGLGLGSQIELYQTGTASIDLGFGFGAEIELEAPMSLSIGCGFVFGASLEFKTHFGDVVLALGFGAELELEQESLLDIDLGFGLGTWVYANSEAELTCGLPAFPGSRWC